MAGYKGRKIYRRRRPFKTVRESFLIICEGENTEPEYFKAFRLTTAVVKTVSAIDKGNALQLVDAAMDYVGRLTKTYDHYWLVFDKDENTKDVFNQAITTALENEFQVAWSNQAFEVWFLYHFQQVPGHIHRRTYSKRLNSFLPFHYGKDKETSRKMYSVLHPYQEVAIVNAKRAYRNAASHSEPADQISVTTVFKLVDDLNKFL